MKSYTVETENLQMNEYRIEFFAQESDPSRMVAGSHLHPAVELLYFIQGGHRVCVDEQNVDAREGDMVLVRSNVIHSVELREGDSGLYYVLKIHPSQVFSIFADHSSPAHAMPFLQNTRNAIVHIPSHALAQQAREIWEKMIAEWNAPDALFFFSQRTYAAALLIALLRTTLKDQSAHRETSRRTVEQIYECVRYIDEHYAQDLTPAACAARLYMSYSHFAKQFRAVTGKNFKAYLTSVRLSHASNLLLGTDMSVTEIALACGYKSASYFISEYRRIKGKTPRAARCEA